jgi:DUF1680 family protein
MKTASKPKDGSARSGQRIPENSLVIQRRTFLKTAGIIGGSVVFSQFSRAASSEIREEIAIDAVSTAMGQGLKSSEAFQSLDFRNVRVGGEIGRRIDITVNNNLLKLDVDKDFLLPFQQKKHEGKGYSDYVGLGKLIDAAVRFAAYTNNGEVIALKNHLIDELIRTQEPDGYIGIMVKEARMWGLWDIHEMGYLIMGLSSDFHHFHEKDSLKAAQKLADYMIERWSTMPANWQKFGAIGLDSNVLALYQETKDKRYLNFCIEQRALADWNLATTKGPISTLKGHVYADLDQCLAQIELFKSRSDERLLASGRRAIDFMCDEDGSLINGAAGYWEEWSDAQEGRGFVGETCATAYQIRLFDHFLRLNGNSRYGDILERIIYNALFAVQSPDGRRLHYFTPLEGKRIYFEKDTYCCPNNFRRIMSELPAFIYYRSAKGIVVNLYTPSETSITLNDELSLKIRQETEYPGNGRVLIHLDPSKPAKFPVQLRIPKWCDKASVSINGKSANEPIVSGKFYSLERLWHPGDQVVIDMVMPFRLVLGRKRQSGRAAVMRGPVVFCFNPAQNDRLQKMDAADLSSYMIDPDSLKLSPGDSTLHPDDVACFVDANERTFSLGTRENSFKLTEFPDPDGKVVYFRIPDLSVAIQDELLSGNNLKK